MKKAEYLIDTYNNVPIDKTRIDSLIEEELNKFESEVKQGSSSYSLYTKVSEKERTYLIEKLEELGYETEETYYNSFYGHCIHVFLPTK